MRRRAFIAGAITTMVCPTFARAEIRRKTRLIAVLVEGRQTSFPLSASPVIRSFVQGMSEAGHVEGREFNLIFRFADGDYAKLPLLAAELVAFQPDVLVTSTVAGTLAIKQATSTIPIVHPSGDCRPVVSIQQDTNGLWMRTVDGQTVLIGPSDPRRSSKDMRWHICVAPDDIGTPKIRCIFEPPNT